MNPKKLFLSSFSFGENEGVPEEGAVSASMTLSVSEQRKSSRRVRNSFNKNGRPFSGSKGLGYMQLRAANAPLLNREESVVEAKSSVSSVILESLAKTNMCDLELIGCDKLPVLAPSYLLACHSVVLEDMFYPKSDAVPKEMSTVPGSGVDKCKERAAPESMNPVYTSIYPRKVELAFASQDAVRGLVHYCATNTLPISMENGSSDNVRSVYQCYLMGQLFKMHPLMEEANRTLRRLVNKNPRLVCAAFDEYIILTRRAALEDNWGFYSGLDSCSLASHSHDNLNKYMLEYLRESPVETLLEGGVALLSPVSIEVIIQDQSMDVDEVSQL